MRALTENVICTELCYLIANCESMKSSTPWTLLA